VSIVNVSIFIDARRGAFSHPIIENGLQLQIEPASKIRFLVFSQYIGPLCLILYFRFGRSRHLKEPTPSKQPSPAKKLSPGEPESINALDKLLTPTSEALETEVSSKPVPLCMTPFKARPTPQPYRLPWSMHGVVDDCLRSPKLSNEFKDLVNHFQNWTPTMYPNEGCAVSTGGFGRSHIAVLHWDRVWCGINWNILEKFLIKYLKLICFASN
jgi:hypothetical protein